MLFSAPMASSCPVLAGLRTGSSPARDSRGSSGDGKLRRPGQGQALVLGHGLAELFHVHVQLRELRGVRELLGGVQFFQPGCGCQAGNSFSRQRVAAVDGCVNRAGASLSTRLRAPANWPAYSALSFASFAPRMPRAAPRCAPRPRFESFDAARGAFELLQPGAMEFARCLALIAHRLVVNLLIRQATLHSPASFIGLLQAPDQPSGWCVSNSSLIRLISCW